MKNKIVLACLLMLFSLGRAHAETPMWLSTGIATTGSGYLGSTFSANVMPSEWGLAYQQVDMSDVGSSVECVVFLKFLFGEDCTSGGDDIAEKSLLLLREFDNAGILLGAGVGVVKRSYANPAIADEEAVGVPVMLTVRSQRFRNLGLSVSLQGNINSIYSYGGVSVKLELGRRHRSE